MQIKETEAMRVISIACSLTIPEVRTKSAELAPLIEKEIRNYGMAVAGPWIFIAQNLPRDSKTKFDWRICRPVTCDDTYKGTLELIHLEPIMVASAMHRGSLRTLFTQCYAPLVDRITMSRHNFSGESRENYHRWTGTGANYHEVEIQFGLAN